jgi:hypothetical protein
VPADLANHAAATAEGYVRVQVDYGATSPMRYVSRYERVYDGDVQSGALRQIEAYDATSQANADQKALDALNGFRRFMFGGDLSNANKGPRSGNALTPGKN